MGMFEVPGGIVTIVLAAVATTTCLAIRRLRRSAQRIAAFEEAAQQAHDETLAAIYEVTRAARDSAGQLRDNEADP